MAAEPDTWTVPVPRERVLEQLHVVRPLLVTIVAPAGYGKTTVCRAYADTWLRSSICQCYGVDEASKFSLRLLEALIELAEPGEAAELRAETNAVVQDANALAECALTAWRSSAAPSLVVFEDFEYVVDNPEIREFFNRLLERRHPTRSIAVCSRRPLGIRTTRFAAPHETIGLGINDLRFDRAEIERACGNRLSSAELDRVEFVTGGWPIGVLFLLRAAAAGNFTSVVDEYARRGDVSLREYVAAEVLAALTPSELAVLHACAVIPKATAREISHATEHDEAAITSTAATLPFVTKSETGEYDVHPLLRAALEEREPASNAILLRAAAGLARDGHRFRAAELYLAAGAQNDAARTVDDPDGTYLLNAPDPRLQTIVRAIDWATLQNHPGLWSTSTLLRIYSRSQLDWLREARTIWSRLEDTAPIALRAGVVGALCNVCGILGRFEEAHRALCRLEESLRGDELAIGTLVLAMWRSTFGVWEGRRVDVAAATLAIAPALENDATSALWNYNFLARDARARGKTSEEDVYLRRAYDAAQRSKVALVIALVISDIIVSAWLSGNRSRFDSALDELEHGGSQSVYRGMHFFIECCRGRGRSAALGFEKLKFRAYGYMIAASQCEDDADALFCIREALSAADECASGFIRALAHVASSIVDRRRRDEHLREAALLADTLESPALIAAIENLVLGRTGGGMLATFVRYFEERGRAPGGRTTLSLSIFEWSIRRDGVPIALKPRELEVLVALALDRKALDRRRLAEMLWPDATAPGAVNALRVNVSRIRAALGAESIVSKENSYALNRAIEIDLETVERTLKSVRFGKAIDDDGRDALASAARFDVATLPPTARRCEWFESAFSRIEFVGREATIVLARESLALEAYADALDFARSLFLRDRCDELACEYTIEALLGLGDRHSALKTLHEHERAMLDELGSEASERLRRLVRTDSVASA